MRNKFIIVVTDWQGIEYLYASNGNTLKHIDTDPNNHSFESEKEAQKHVEAARETGVKNTKSKKVLVEVRAI